MTVTATLYEYAEPEDVVADNQEVDYSYTVEILTANGNWVEADSGDGEDTTDVNGQVEFEFDFVTSSRANTYRVNVTFQNRTIGTVTDSLIGA